MSKWKFHKTRSSFRERLARYQWRWQLRRLRFYTIYPCTCQPLIAPSSHLSMTRTAIEYCACIVAARRTHCAYQHVTQSQRRGASLHLGGATATSTRLKDLVEKDSNEESSDRPSRSKQRVVTQGEEGDTRKKHIAGPNYRLEVALFVLRVYTKKNLD
jgi:hypothetical protein